MNKPRICIYIQPVNLWTWRWKVKRPRFCSRNYYDIFNNLKYF